MASRKIKNYCGNHNALGHLVSLNATASKKCCSGCFCRTPRGVRLKCYYAFFLVCCGCDTSYIVSVHSQCQASIYPLSLYRGHSWRVRLAKQETLTPPGYLVARLVCRGPWKSTVVLYCWCISHLYFTFLSHLFPLPCEAGSTVPREGFDSSVIMHFSWCVVAVTLPI